MQLPPCRRFEAQDELFTSKRMAGSRGEAERVVGGRVVKPFCQVCLPSITGEVFPPDIHVQEPRTIDACHMCHSARPWPFPRARNQARPNRIQFNITERLPKMVVVQGARVKAVLPKVAG